VRQTLHAGRRTLFINSLSTIIVRVLNVTVIVWLHQYLIRRVTPEEYSVYPVVMSLVVFAPLLTTILTAGLGRYLAEAYVQEDHIRLSQVASTMATILFLASIALIGIGWLVTRHLETLLNIPAGYVLEAKVMFGMLILSMAIRLPFVPMGMGLYVRQKFLLTNAIELGFTCLRLTFMMILLFAVGPRVLWVVVASVVAVLLQRVVVVYLSLRSLPSLMFRMRSVNFAKTKDVISFGGWAFVGQIFDKIRESADPIILNLLAAPHDVTCFYIGSLAFRQIQGFAVAARQPMLPALVEMHEGLQRDRWRNMYYRVGRYSLWASLFLAVPLIVFREAVMTAYVGEQYVDAATVMALMCGVFPIAYSNALMPDLARAKAEVRGLALRLGALHGSNLVLTLFLVGKLRMGATGSALATFIVFAVGTPLLQIPFGLRLADASVREWYSKCLKPGLVPAIICSAVLYLLREFTKAESLAALLAFFLSHGMLYAYTVWAVAPDGDKDLLRSGLRRTLRCRGLASVM
jgi:O-antigen/teichoic acid export membrane protein